MSFIAQYTGIKSNNTTFGNTSYSAINALQEAKLALLNSPCAIVNSSNCGGDYSFLTNSSVVGHSNGWRESAGVACLLLESEASGSSKPIAKITHLKSSFAVPNLEIQKIERNWSNLLKDNDADAIVCSGAYSELENRKDIAYCKEFNNNIHSHFNEMGNMGPSNVFFGIIKAIKLIEGNCKIVDVLDRDIFGRESVIRIEKC